MNFAIVGCGYVADFYMSTLRSHPELNLLGVYDRNDSRLRQFSSYYQVRAYASLDELLNDKRVALVANLTNPSAHYAISRAALEAEKHVYSEKPLAMDLDEARSLVTLAEEKGKLLASAPCSILSETAQTVWRALRNGLIGIPRLVYAELDDGNVPRTNYPGWISSSGAPWPAKDEFEVGCTLEHAGYYLTWLTAFFGPVVRMSSFAHVTQPDKGIALDKVTPDMAVGCFEFRSGVAARLTCSIYAPHDQRLRIFGDSGSLSIEDCWDYGAAVHLRRNHRYSFQLEKRPFAVGVLDTLGLGRRRLSLARKPMFRSRSRGANPMDFCRGIADLAAAAHESCAPRLSARWSLHVNELVLAMQNPQLLGQTCEIHSTFEPMAPMSWAT